MGFILFILLLAGGILAYIYLVEMEAEIRAEISAAAEPLSPKRPDPGPPRTVESGASLEEKICEQVRLVPEILQANLYARLPGNDRKQIQKAVLDLVRSGRLARVRSGSSYKLTFTD